MKTEQEIRLLAESIEYIVLHTETTLTDVQTDDLATSYLTLKWVLGEPGDESQRKLSISFETIVASARFLQEMAK